MIRNVPDLGEEHEKAEKSATLGAPTFVKRKVDPWKGQDVANRRDFSIDSGESNESAESMPAPKKARYETKRQEEPGSKKSKLDKEITFKFNLRKSLKFLVILMILSSVFILGRYSADGTRFPGTSGKSGFPFSFNFSKLFSKVGSNNSSEATTQAVANTTVEETPAAETTEAVPEDTPVETAPPEEVKEEPVVTDYAGVTLEIGKITREWKGAWGKITKFEYTVKNEASGTIKPDYFVMNVKGYQDLDKTIPLPLSSKTMLSGKTYGSIATVPQGFAYSPTSVDVAAVEVTVLLYDAEGRLIDSAVKTASLGE